MPRRRVSVDSQIEDQLADAVRASRQTVSGLARALGCDRSTLHKWLNGTNPIPPDALARLCDLIDLPEQQRAAQFAGRGYARAAPPAVPVGSAAPALRQLRAPVRDFVGRADEIAQIVGALVVTAADGALAAVCGVRGLGGMGKTELAYAAAWQLTRQFPDGQIVLALRGAGSDPVAPNLALQQVLRAFEPHTPLPDSLHELHMRYRSTLSGRRVLILADDAADAEQVRALHPPPGSALLITTRQRFVLPGLVSVDLDVLPATLAEQMLLAICPRIGAAAAHLARLCGYLPLALRVSASLLASDDTYDIAHYLGQLATARLAYLRDPERPDDPQASVEASLALSYDALPAAAQDALCRLGVFPASFDRAAAAALLPDGGELALLLGQLRRRSLIEWDAQHARHLLHDLVREFALSRLHDTAAVRQRHAVYFLQLAEQSPAPSRTPDTGWLATMEREHANLRAALDWLLRDPTSDAALRLVAALGPFWLARDHLREGGAALSAALAHSPPGSERLRATALTHATMLARVQGQLPAARRTAAESRMVWQWLEDEQNYAEATFQLGLVLQDQGEKLAARAYFEESLIFAHQLNQPARVGAVLASLGRMALDAGDYATAQQHFAESHALLRASDDTAELAWLLTNMARHAGAQGEHTVALGYVDEALHHFEHIQHTQGLAWTLRQRGLRLLALGQLDAADAALAQSLALFERLANTVGCATVHQELAELARARDQPALVQQHALVALQLYQTIDNRAGVGLCLVLLAWTGIAHDGARAAALLGASAALLSTTGVNVQASEYAWHAQVIDRARASLPATVFADSWAHGQRLSLNQAVTLATMA